MKRQRGRGRKPGGNPVNRPLESNGPDVKIRGTAAQIYEKYSQYARDAQSAGDRVRCENFLQHAEHYFRLMMSMSPRDRFEPRGEGQDQPLREAEDTHDPMKVVDDVDEDDPVSAVGEAPDEDDDSSGEDGPEFEPRGEGGPNRNRRRRGRRRPSDLEAAGAAPNGQRPPAPPPQDPEARSALEALAQRQAAAAGG